MNGKTFTELASLIVKESPDAILAADRNGIIRLWNFGAERIFGYSQDEAVGQSLDIIIPSKMRNRHWDGYNRVLETGISKYNKDLLSVPAMHKSGRQLSCEFSIVMIKDDSGKIEGFASIMRDVTQRFQKEQELKERLRELTQSGG